MRLRCTAKGYVGLAVGCTAGLIYLLMHLLAAPSVAPAQPGGGGSNAPTETIDVERAVDFPYDI